MRLRFSRLRWPEWMVGGGGLMLLGSMPLLPWYSRTRRSGRLGPKRVVRESVDGWHGLGHARWLVSVTGLAAFAVMFFQARQRAPALPAAATSFAVPLATATGVWLIVRVWIAPPGEREIGGWVGLVGATAIAYGGYKSVLMEGIAATDAPAEIPTIDLEHEGLTGLEREGAT
jgi:hypothetical protein